MRRFIVIIAAIGVAVLAAIGAMRGTVRLGAEGYVYGYPLVIMDVTMQQFAATRAAPNTLDNVERFPDASFRGVVRPNVDTLYSVAWLDLAKGPRVFEVPATDRYYVMQFLDGWTNVFASVGPRTTGRGAGTFLIAGPGWTGALPPGVTLLRAPTRMAWMIGRIQTNGVADYAFVHGLQGQLRLRSLDDYLADRESQPVPWKAASREPDPPLYQMRSMRPEEFFTRLARLLPDNPPAAGDGPALEGLEELGVSPGRPPGPWGSLKRRAVSLGMWIARRRMLQAIANPPALVDGWRVPPMSLGDYGTDYGLRAVVAMAGLGANLPADAVYPNTRLDGEGHPLEGAWRYVLHFDADRLPPVRAFWSVTAYDSEGYLVANELNRYALGDRDDLAFNSDGSLDIYIQSNAPPPDKRSNWLPVPSSGPFQLSARLYWPEPRVLAGDWHMPGIRRIRD